MATTEKPIHMLDVVDPQANLATQAVTRVAAMESFIKGLEQLNKLLDMVPRVPEGDDMTAEQAGKAADLLKYLNTVGNRAEATRKAETGPVDKALKAVNKLFREAFTNPITEAKKIVGGRLGRYHELEDQRKAEAARQAAEDAEMAALEMAETLEKVGAKDAAEAALDVGMDTAAAEEKAAKPAVIRGDHGGATHTRKTWKWRLVDKGAVPAEYLTVDSVLVNEAVRSGVREIPGLEIYQETKVVAR